MANKTHWKALTNPNYLGSYSFEDGKDIIGTIKVVRNELVTGEGGRKEECTICHFVEPLKPMILNKTNMKTIAKLFKTPYVEEWAGQKIQIYVDPKVKFGKEITGGLRVRDKIIKVDNTCVKCEECGKDIQPRSGMTSLQFAEYTKVNCGKAVCYDCAIKVAAAKKERSDEQ